MAGESINTSVTPEIMEPNGGDLRRIFVGKPNGGQNMLLDYCRASTGSYHYGSNSRRNSMGKPTTPNNGQNILPQHIRASTGSCRDVVNLRRSSTGLPSSPSSGESVVPHYLRASTGSCHDFCKYGRKHEFEVKPRHPIPKRRITPPSERLNPTEFGVSGVRKTTTVVKLNPSPVLKVPSPDSPSFIKQEVSSPSKKVEVSSRHASSNEKKIAQIELKTNLSGKRTPVKPKTMTVKPSSSPDTSGGLNGRRNTEIKIAKQTGTSKAAVKKMLGSPADSLSPNPSNGRRNSEIKIAKQTGTSKEAVKKKRVSPAASLSPIPSNGRRNSKIKIAKQTETSKTAVKKILASPAASLAPKPSISRVLSLNVKKYSSLKLVSPLKDRNRIRKAERKQSNSEMVPEKTLHVIKVETENKVLESAQYGSTIHSPLSPLSSSPKSSSLSKSPALSFHEEEAQEVSEYTDIKVETENKVLESAQYGSTIHSPPSPALSFREEEAQEESEYTDTEADEADDSISESSETINLNEVETSEGNPKSPALSFHEEEAQEVSEYTDIKVETENKVLESAQCDSTIHSPLSPTLSAPKSSSLPKSPALSSLEEEVQEESEYTDSEVDEADDSISESSETVNLNEIETLEGNHKRTPRKGGVGLSDDKDCAPTKMKFQRGKVVDLQSEKSGPRRLRFRRGRVLGGNQDGKADVRKRSFRKRGVEDDTNGTDPDSEKVVLRHQDVQGKKDAQGLFNNVIEETASKLVESRKSKVKALVGAFETVISLQESKPST